MGVIERDVIITLGLGTKPDQRGTTTKAVLEDKQHSLREHVCQRFSFSASKIGIQFSYYPRKREGWLMFHKSIGGFHTWSLEGLERVPFPPQPVTHPMTVTPQCGIILRLSSRVGWAKHVDLGLSVCSAGKGLAEA